MSERDDTCDDCCVPDPYRGDPRWRRVLWIVLTINLAMFAVESVALDVFGSDAGGPDIPVAAIMAGLALHGAALVVGQSVRELAVTAVRPAQAKN